MSITKIVSRRELDITLMANELNVCPRILKYGKSDIYGEESKLILGEEKEWYYITMEKCNIIPELTDNDKKEYILLYKKLLDNGIYYFDISKYNIVKDRYNSLKIIDYGHAHIGEFNTFHIRMWYNGQKEDLMQYVINTLILIT